MRTPLSVIIAVLNLLPTTDDASTAANFNPANVRVLRDNLEIMQRWAYYCPPEGASDLWVQIGQTIQRYLPPATASSLAGQISNVLTGA